MYAVYHGPSGLKEIAAAVHRNALSLSFQLEALGFKQENEYFFDTLKVNTSGVSQTQIA
jgi:glycine dehydrogenase